MIELQKEAPIIADSEDKSDVPSMVDTHTPVQYPVSTLQVNARRRNILLQINHHDTPELQVYGTREQHNG